MSYSKKISPLTIESFSSLGGRSENTLFYQGGFSQSWRNCSFYKCRYELINFKESEINGVTFNETEFHKTSFSHSKLTQLSFNQCIISNSTFDNALINSSSFQNSVLENSSFVKTIFANTSFYQAKLHYCNFQGADLSQTNLEAAESLLGCEFDQFTKLPFAKQVAYQKGMIYSPKLELLTESSPVPNNIINFPKIEKSEYDSSENAAIINFVDYVKLKKLNNEGPQSA